MSKTIPERVGIYSDCILGINSGAKHCEDGSKCASCASSGVDGFDCYAAVMVVTIIRMNVALIKMFVVILKRSLIVMLLSMT